MHPLDLLGMHFLCLEDEVIMDYFYYTYKHNHIDFHTNVLNIRASSLLYDTLRQYLQRLHLVLINNKNKNILVLYNNIIQATVM